MKARVEYITKVVKEIEVPDRWAESNWEDEEIEQFWQNIAKTEDKYYFKPSGIYYGDDFKWVIAEY